MVDRRRRRILIASSAVAGGALLPRIPAAQQRIVMNDASRLSPTPVFSHWIVRPNPEEQIIATLRKELKAAASRGRPVVVGAARHSMGGQSLARNGTRGTRIPSATRCGDSGRKCRGAETASRERSSVAQASVLNTESRRCMQKRSVRWRELRRRPLASVA